MAFANKVVIVTGASSGIGAATAEVFAKRGANIVLIGRNAKNLEQTEKTCLSVCGDIGDCLVIQADVTTDAHKIINDTIKKYGRIDVLVNNAGILAAGGILETDIEQFDHVLNTNLRSVFILTKLAVPYLLESKGSIINVSSVAGIRSFGGFISYGVSKAALDQFTRCLALELAPKHVRVNAVNPGVVITDIHRRGGMSEEQYAEYLERSKDTHAMGRVGNVYEVAETIVFLASEGASFITGTCLPIDGGKHVMCPR